MKKMLTLVLVLMLVVMAMPASAAIYTGDPDAITSMLDSWFEEEETVEETPEYNVKSIEDVEAMYSFTLEGKKYTFPCPIEELLDNGWSFVGWAENPEAELEAMTYTSTGMTNAAGQYISVEIMNPTQSTVAANKTRILSITVRQQDNPPTFATGLGLKIGDPMSGVPALYGEGYREYDVTDGGKDYIYNFYMLLNSTPYSIEKPLTQESGDDKLEVLSGADGKVHTIMMMHAKF